MAVVVPHTCQGLLGAAQIDPDIEAILADPAAACLTASSDPFWFVVAALRDFVAGEGAGKLPVSGHVRSAVLFGLPCCAS